MYYTELKQWIPVTVLGGDGIPAGNGFAMAVVDYGQEHHALWVVTMDETGEIWWPTNSLVRVRPNPSMKAKRVSKFIDDPPVYVRDMGNAKTES